MKRCRIVAVAAALLTACAASPPVHYYHLEIAAADAVTDRSGAAVLVVGPLTFPEYLERPQMVRRGRGTELLVDELHRWAEPLDEAVLRVLAANVDALDDALVVVPFARRTITPDLRLFATVQRFDTDAAGVARLVVQWGVTNREGAVTLAPRTERFQAQAVPAGDPGAAAAAMSDLLAQLARSIVAALGGR